MADTSSPDTADGDTLDGETDEAGLDGADSGSDADSDVVVEPNAADCDPLVPEVCAMPWPSSYFLAEDPLRATGYTLRFGPTTLPSNTNGIHVDPAPYTRMDGYGVGTPIMVHFPTLDSSDLVDETRIEESLAPDAKIMLFAVGADGQLVRVPNFAEVDLGESDESKRVLFVRPAVLLDEGTRYVVAMRGLVARDGAPLEPSPAFRALRDTTSTGTPVEGRQAHFDELFTMLEAAGVERAGLLLAWDYWTASHEALHAPILHMRDDALNAVGALGPELFITTITPVENSTIAYEVEGTFEVPHYLVRDDIRSLPAYSLNRDADGMPQQTGTRRAHFRVRIPQSALNGTPHGIVLHGHGLNGSDDQIGSGWFGDLAKQEHFIIVGANMIGMSFQDAPTTAAMTFDLSTFPRLSDRLHQGLIEHLLLVRAIRERFAQLPEIAALGLVIDPDSVWYNGISQGGIFGGSLMALSTEITRGQLGVPGSNYSLLLKRSTDFGPFFALIRMNYPRTIDQALLLACIQVHWDQVDPVSYYHHISRDPFPNTPSHRVLMSPAKGDWQVAVLSNEIVARSPVGIPIMEGYGRDVPLTTPQTYPYAGSGIVLYDFGNPWPAPGPVLPDDAFPDPHELPRRLAAHNDQMMHFWRTGEIIDVCGGDGCTPD